MVLSTVIRRAVGGIPVPIRSQGRKSWREKMKSRPIGVTVLAVLAALLAVFAAYRVLQFLGLFPFWVGPVPFKTFSFFAALMWGLMVWVYIWLTKMLWDVDPQAWLFLAVISVFNLILEFVALTGSNSMQDAAVPFILNATL